MSAFSLSSVQRITQVAAPDPLLQPEEHRARLTADEGHAGVLRNVSCSAAKDMAGIKL